MKRTFSPSTTSPPTPTDSVLAKAPNAPDAHIYNDPGAYTYMVFIIYSHVAGFGLFEDPALALWRNSISFRLTSEKILRSKVSPIDMSLAQGSLGNVYGEERDYAKASRYGEELFEGDSFWAPLGGIIWAWSLKEMGKPQEAEAVLQALIRRFPANKEIVLRLQKEWAAESKQK